MVAEFPDRKPVVLSGIAEEEPNQRPAGRKLVNSSADKRPPF